MFKILTRFVIKPEYFNRTVVLVGLYNVLEYMELVLVLVLIGLYYVALVYLGIVATY